MADQTAIRNYMQSIVREHIDVHTNTVDERGLAKKAAQHFNEFNGTVPQVYHIEAYFVCQNFNEKLARDKALADGTRGTICPKCKKRSHSYVKRNARWYCPNCYMELKVSGNPNR